MPGRYLQSLYRTSRLDALLGKHAEMLLEVKNLDSDMQARRTHFHGTPQ